MRQKATGRRGRRPRAELYAPGVPYTMKLADGRTVFVEVPGRMAMREADGELSFTPEGVRFLDRVRALAAAPTATPSPAYLATLREALGLTQAELGRLLGRDKLTVSRWERGAMRPSPEALEKLHALARKRKEEGVSLAG